MACVVFVRDPKSQKWRRWLALRGCPFGGKDEKNKRNPQPTSKIWTSATCRNSSHVNCMCGTRDNVLQPNPWDPVNHPCILGFCLFHGSLYLGDFLKNGNILNLHINLETYGRNTNRELPWSHFRNALPGWRIVWGNHRRVFAKHWGEWTYSPPTLHISITSGFVTAF
jgi:hypothetical protein